MKRASIFILFIFYLGFSTGFTFQRHYCMGQIIGSAFWLSSEKEVCKGCGMLKNNAEQHGCCEDERILVKMENDQDLTKGSLAFPSPFIPSVVNTPAWRPYVYFLDDTSILPKRTFIFIHKQARHLLNSVFLI